MGNEPLANLVRTGGLKAEPADKNECIGLARSALDRLLDAHNSALSYASRFDLAYNAAHAMALSALRLKGYRSDRRYLVFQCLPHTLIWIKCGYGSLRFATSAETSLSTKATWISMTRCSRSYSRVPKHFEGYWRRRWPLMVSVSPLAHKALHQ